MMARVTLKHIVPTIVLLLVALGVFLIDPMRRAGPALQPSLLAESLAPVPELLGPWQLDGREESMPRAYQPLRSVYERTERYSCQADSAYVRVVIACDRRDLLAYVPSHAMHRKGWLALPVEIVEGLERSNHTYDSGLLVERITVESAYVLPGRWGPDAGVFDREAPMGSGWPGPGAVVQLLLTNPHAPANELREHVRELAQALALALQTGGAP